MDNPQQRDLVTQLYEHVKSIPTISSGSFIASSSWMNDSLNTSSIELSCSYSDYQNDKMINILKQYHVFLNHSGISSDQAVVSSVFPSIVPSEIHASSISPSGQRKALFKCISQDGKPNAQTGALDYQIEIYANQLLQTRVLVKDVHGKLFTDETFARVSWSTDENKILYVAELKQEIVKPYWEKPKPSGSDNNGSSSSSVQSNFEFKYDYERKEDWGEQILLKNPHLYELDIKAKQVTHIDLIPNNVSAGSPIYLKNSNQFVYVGYDKPVRKLGLKYCMQRDAKLFYCDRQKVDQIAKQFRGVRRPVFSPCGTKLAFLAYGNDVNYHNSTSKLVTLNWNESKTDYQVIVDIVQKVSVSKEVELMQVFPGLYTAELPLNCWSADSRYIIVNSIWRSVTSMLLIDTSKTSENVKRVLGNAGSYDSIIFLNQDASKKKILFYQTTPTSPYQIYVADINYENGELSNLRLLEDGLQTLEDSLVENASLRDKIKEVAWKVLHIPVEKESNVFMDGILYVPKTPKGFLGATTSSEEKKHSLIAFPHGGPHSAFITTFSSQSIFYALCGYAVLFINYRGSVGFGQEFAGCLPGVIGDLDVKDCHTAIQYVMDHNVLEVDPQSISALGGSHGGFLAAHLIGQYPDLFKCSIMRNPVINLSTIYGESDIPDWCYCESLGNEYYDEAYATKDMVMKMYEQSPISHVNKVTAAVMLLVGEVDRRVPKEQPREFYHALKFLGKSKDVKMLVYPENDHPIAKPNAEFDSMVSSILFLYAHAK
ncbi:hypothetical protein C9374_005063 [Naegleria lovaniensis]|uniref:acylaminoacyl-peptidase n=1 Tax=Naegleria lovaniensis TaxID=51637 RepID=A0AA88GQT4_NAELO|nr:uncharacterized protein C9374_005063 [Naegleria lovaniensis]KAG2382483.1 hypothetical protein C9374_005063 [Naegleria lovaniensis]